MLIQPDINELGDKRLDPKEGVAQKREECLALAAKKRIYGQSELEDPHRAFGPRIQFSEMVSRLRRLIPQLKIIDGMQGHVALYAPRNAGEIKERKQGWLQEQSDALARGRKKQSLFFLHYKYVGGFPKTDLQEFTTLDVDNAQLATKEHRCWRTVLIGLMNQGLISYQTTVKEFGDIGTDRRGWRWLESTRKWRNNPTQCFSN